VVAHRRWHEGRSLRASSTARRAGQKIQTRHSWAVAALRDISLKSSSHRCSLDRTLVAEPYGVPRPERSEEVLSECYSVSRATPGRSGTDAV